jgi:CHAT domain-containing protein
MHTAVYSMSSVSRLFLYAMLVAVLVLGCSNEPLPEQRQADLALQRAQQALGQERYRESRRLLFSALTLDRRLGRMRQVGEELRLLGEAFASVADYDSALIFYQQAIEQYKSLADRNSVRSLTLDIASLYRWMGEERTAFTMYTEALRLANVFNDKEGAREIQRAMLPACRQLENAEEESRILTDLLDYYTVSGDAGKQAGMYLEVGVSKLQRWDYNRALENLLRALTLAEQAHDSVLAINVLLKLAVTYGELGKITESFQAYTEGLKRSDITRGVERLRLEMLVRVGDTYLMSGQYGEARRFYHAALSAAMSRQNTLAEGYLFIQLGHCDLHTDAAAAEKNYESALELFDGVSYPPGSSYAAFSLGVAAQRTSHYSEALQHFKQAVEQSEASLWRQPGNELFRSSEETFFRANQTALYDGIIELLLQLGRNDEAFWYVERKHGRELFDELSAFNLQTHDTHVDSLLRIYKHARALHIGAERQLAQVLTNGFHNREMIREIHKNREQASKAITEVGSRMTEINPSFQLAVSISNIGLVEAQKLLPQGTALVEPVPTNRSLFTFIVTNKGSTTVVAAIPKARVQAMAQEFLEHVRLRGVYADSAAELVKPIDKRLQESIVALYGAFVQPIERSLPPVTKLIVVPQREFSAVPLHVLRRSLLGTGPQYMCEQYLISYLPAAVGLALSAAQSRTRRVPAATASDIVALGHPGETAWDVEYELRDIRAFDKEARLYFNQRATLATLQKESAAVVHLAAEFRFNDQAPGNAYLVLSDGKSLGSIRHVSWGELCTLPPFGTVILSDLSNDAPRAVPALPLLFLMNGTSSVVLNAFTPSRKAKKLFGEQFYTAFLAGQTGQVAFRQAQLEMIKTPNYTWPYLWGSFCLWGK